ncbi:MAG: peptide permease, partial [Bacillus sp. (in: firmicutes)]
KNVVQDAYGGPPPLTMVRKWNELYSLQEVFVKIILGLESTNSFDDYVKRWYESGGTQVTQEVNDWHESHKK